MTPPAQLGGSTRDQAAPREGAQVGEGPLPQSRHAARKSVSSTTLCRQHLDAILSWTDSDREQGQSQGCSQTHHTQAPGQTQLRKNHRPAQRPQQEGGQRRGTGGSDAAEESLPTTHRLPWHLRSGPRRSHIRGPEPEPTCSRRDSADVRTTVQRWGRPALVQLDPR